MTRRTQVENTKSGLALIVTSTTTALKQIISRLRAQLRPPRQPLLQHPRQLLRLLPVLRARYASLRFTTRTPTEFRTTENRRLPAGSSVYLDIITCTCGKKPRGAPMSVLGTTP